MDYTRDAMRFVVQGENALSPVLRKIYKDYDKYATKIEEQNVRLYKSFSRTTKKIATSIEAMAEFPAKAKSAMSKLARTIEKMKPLSVPVKFKIDENSAKGFLKGIPRFAKGGIVPDSNLPKGLRMGKDGTLILASAGELIIPPKTAKEIMDLQATITQLTKAMEDAGGAGNKQGKEMLQTGIANYAAKLSEKLAGLEGQAKKSGKAIGNLKTEEKKLADVSKTVADTTEKKVTPSIEKSSKATKDYNKEVHDTNEEEARRKRKLDEIAGDTRFLALSKIAGTLFGLPSQLGSQAEHLGAGESNFGSFYDSMNHANMNLHLSRGGLRDERRRFAQMATDSGVALPRFGEAYDALASMGMRGNTPGDLQAIRDAAALSAQLSQANGNQTPTDIAQYIYQSKDRRYGSRTDSQIKQALVAQDKLTQFAGTPTDVLLKDTMGFRSGAGTLFTDMTGEQQLNSEKATSTLSALLHRNFAGPRAESILRDIGGSLQNDPQAITRLGAGYGITRSDTLALLHGNGAGVVSKLQDFSNTLRGAGPNALAVAHGRGLEDMTSEDVTAFVQNLGNASRQFEDLRRQSATTAVSVDDDLKKLIAGTQTLGQSIQAWIGGKAVSFHLDEVYGTLKELNPQMLMAATYATKLAATSLWNVGKGAVSVGAGALGLAGKGISKVTGLFGAAETVEETTGKGLKAIAGGVSSFGNPVGILATGAAVSGIILAIGGAARLSAPAIKASAEGLAMTIQAITGTTSQNNIDPDQVRKSGERIKAVGGVLNDLKGIIFDYSKIQVGTFGSSRLESLFSAREVSTTVRILGTIGEVENVLAKTYENTNVSGAAKLAANIRPHLQAMGEVMRGLADMVAATDAAGAGAQGGERSWRDRIRMVDGPINALEVMGPKIANISAQTLKLYSTIPEESVIQTSVGGISRAGEIVTAALPLYKATLDAGEIAQSMETGTVDIIRGVDGPLSALEAVGPRIPDVVKAIKNNYATIPTDIGASLEGVGRAGKLVEALTPFYTSVVTLGKEAQGLEKGWTDVLFLKNGPLDTLIKVDPNSGKTNLDKITDFAFTVSDAFYVASKNHTSSNMPAALAGMSNATYLIQGFEGVLAAISHAATYASDAMKGVGNLQSAEQTIGPLVQKLGESFLFSADKNKTIKIQVQASDEQKEEVELLREAVRILGQMLIVQSGGKIPQGIAGLGINPTLQALMQINPIMVGG